MNSTYSSTSATEEYNSSTVFTPNKTFTYDDTTGELDASGSFSGSFQGDGSQLTGLSADPFPYSGSADITGSLQVTGSTKLSSLVAGSGTAIWYNGATTNTDFGTAVTAGDKTDAIVVGNNASNAETYDGTSYTTVTNPDASAGSDAIVGNGTSAYLFGGSGAPATQTYNGGTNTWNSGAPQLASTVSDNVGVGTPTDALSFSGLNSVTAYTIFNKK